MFHIVGINMWWIDVVPEQMIMIVQADFGHGNPFDS